ncbi:hypothetical protein WA026_002941 [Henosepilachna vigintioctopunctata]|uniref:Secreted protein n=1 Tax=Henosepilachna vigintioctopunctata TaxID=420089 RepID=A0AAW1TLP5_9CUCU
MRRNFIREYILLFVCFCHMIEPYGRSAFFILESIAIKPPVSTKIQSRSYIILLFNILGNYFISNISKISLHFHERDFIILPIDFVKASKSDKIRKPKKLQHFFLFDEIY